MASLARLMRRQDNLRRDAAERTVAVAQLRHQLAVHEKRRRADDAQRERRRADHQRRIHESDSYIRSLQANLARTRDPALRANYTRTMEAEKATMAGAARQWRQQERTMAEQLRKSQREKGLLEQSLATVERAESDSRQALAQVSLDIARARRRGAK